MQLLARQGTGDPIKSRDWGMFVDGTQASAGFDRPPQVRGPSRRIVGASRRPPPPPVAPRRQAPADNRMVST